MNKRIISMALASLMTIMGAQAMQQAVTKEMPKVKVRINNKTNKNYLITTSQKYHWRKKEIVTTQQNANAINMGVKAGGSSEFSLTLNEIDQKSFISGFHRYKGMFLVTDGKKSLSANFEKDVHDNYGWAMLRMFLWALGDPNNPYLVGDDSLRTDFEAASKKDVAFYVTIDLKGEDLKQTVMDISAIQN